MNANKLIMSIILIIALGCSKNNQDSDGCLKSGIDICTAERLSESLEIIVTPLKVAPTYSSDFIPTKDDFVLDIYARVDFSAYHTSYDSGSEELQNRLKWMSGLIKNGLIEYKDEFNLRYYFAGILDGAKIYADRVLWGREPGEDLGDMFKVPFYRNDVLVTYPEFYVLYGRNDKHPETFRELTSNRIALANSCITSVTFAEIPPEEFDTVTLTVEIPIDVEYYEDYSPEMYEQHPTLKPEGRRLLKGSVTVKFAE